MRFSFRLSELLGHTPDAKRRPGTIKAIVDHTGLDRHQVSALLNNEVKYIPLVALSRLCDYLIEHGHASADQLPGALFAIEAENFWELVARRQRLELCVGVRSAPAEWSEGALIMAADAVLMGEMLNGVSTLGGTAKYRHHVVQDGSEQIAPLKYLGPPPQPEHLRQTLVWSPQQGPQDEFEPRAQQVYNDFAGSGNDKALISLGSWKSNPVAELVMARAFDTVEFVAQDDAPAAAERACPIFMGYRPTDPHTGSCAGGFRLSVDGGEAEPGIHYEKADGSWACCPWDAESRDAAMVFYIHRESQGHLEMVLGGFSSRGTRLLARTLATRADEFWPPVFTGRGLSVGAFIVEYTLKPQDKQRQDILVADPIGTPKIIALDEETISRRIEPTPGRRA